MSLDSPISVGDAYASFLLDEWKKAYEIRKAQRFNLVSRIQDNEVTNDYISILICLYIELEPKVKGRTELKEFQEKFREFRPYINNPQMLLPIAKQSKEGGDIIEIIDCDKILELENILREIIEQLNITTFEK